VIFSGGVMATLPLLLKMKEDPHGLPRLYDRLGDFVRTNSESLIGVAAPDSDVDYSKGIAITSLLHTDEHSHLEPVRYGPGSDFFRFLTWPHGPGTNVVERVGRMIQAQARNRSKAPPIEIPSSQVSASHCSLRSGYTTARCASRG